MKKLLFSVIVAIIAVLTLVVLPLSAVYNLPDEVRLTEVEYQSNKPLPAGPFVAQSVKRSVTVSDEGDKYVDLNLFGIFRVKRVKVDILPFDQVLAGGIPIGFSAKTDGVIVLEPAGNLKKGDIIKAADGTPIVSIEDFREKLEKTKKSHIDIEVERGGKRLTTQIECPDEKTSLGLWLKDETSGVGMLTYVNPQNNNFASLGHNITDFETGVTVDVCKGDVYKVNVIGIEPSSAKTVGEFKSTLKQGSSGKQGSVLSSNEAGVFGCLNADNSILRDAMSIYPVCSRYSVKPGAAKLRTSLDGVTVEEFNIEIIKTHYQKHKATKSMVIRITDKELLAKTGGIIHGMSGSPIIQKGKIVGALTHVIMGDPTKGYGIYIDFVIP